MSEVLLIPVNVIKERSPIDMNIDDKLIGLTILDIQETILEPIIGTKLYDKLLADVRLGAVADPYRTLIISKIWKVLIHSTIMQLASNLSYTYANSSTSKLSTEPAESDVDLDKFMVYRERTYKVHADKLSKYLVANSASFPEYTETSKLGYEPRVEDSDVFYVEDPFL